MSSRRRFAGFPRQDCSPCTEGYTYAARVWDLSIVQGPFSGAPRAKGWALGRLSRWLSVSPHTGGSSLSTVSVDCTQSATAEPCAKPGSIRNLFTKLSSSAHAAVAV
jgi:hypothetical protein